MKQSVITAAALFGNAVLATGVAFRGKNAVASIDKDTRQSPINRVVALITSLKDQIEADHSSEQKSYDKFACWCEKTFQRKIKDIADGKEFIAKAEKQLVKLSGEIGSHQAEIKDLNKQIAANKDAQKEATEVRDGEFAEYKEERTESEQCIGALEAAIGVLTGAGEGKKGKFLETLQQAKLISVAGDVGRVLKQTQKFHATSDADMEVVRKFIAHPQDFMGAKAPTELSAVQMQKNNPFGDYAPQSTQIQGILKGMYDGITSDLEKDNAEESNKEKQFREFIKIKQMELATLEKTLAAQELALATKTKEKADLKTDRDNAQDQLETDEAFFATTKKNCQDTAIAWGDRTRMRTEEINGVIKAIEILSSPEAQATFRNSSTTLIQLDHGTVHLRQGTKGGSSSANVAKMKAYQTLSALSAKYQNLGLASIAAEVKTGGHFDKIQMMIDQMIDLLRKEEQEDIDHRDRCENAENANGNNKEDTVAHIGKTNNAIRVNALDIKAAGTEKAALEDSIVATKKAMKELLDMRNEEEAEFKLSVKHDTEAIDIIQQAIAAISKFYKNHDIPLSLAQKTPEYTQDNDTAPELNWGGDKHRSEESGGIVAIMSMLIEDVEKEMREAKNEDAEAQADYVKDRTALEKTLNAQERSLANKEQEIADMQAKDAELNAQKVDLEDRKDALDTEAGNLVHDCSWLRTHFDSRKSARKLELEGLQSAKAILAGVDAGDWDQVAISR